MNSPNDWKQLYMKARASLLDMGIDNVHLEMVLFCMMYAGEPYRTSVSLYAEFQREAPERMHSYLCYALLRCGVEVGPGVLLTKLAGGGVNDENGVSAATGS